MAKRGASRVAKSSIQRPTGREVIAFIKKFLRIPDGPSAGQPLILAPWQKQEIYRIYDNPVGTRRAVISTARKNSKTAQRCCSTTFVAHPRAIVRIRVCTRARKAAIRLR
jgi:phage terminase large subunit-like protein